jgi:hypothetical protein
VLGVVGLQRSGDGGVVAEPLGAGVGVVVVGHAQVIGTRRSGLSGSWRGTARAWQRRELRARAVRARPLRGRALAGAI